ncbi:MAG: hypothetical protein ACJ8AG_02540 [Ktedonobacteraceae bacterium]
MVGAIPCAFTGRFFQTNMGSGLVPVGAGVVMGWVGLGLRGRRHDDIPCGRPRGFHRQTKGARSPGETTSTRIPTPQPNLSRPYGDEGLSPKKPTRERTLAVALERRLCQQYQHLG